jgi:hypothetical protein
LKKLVFLLIALLALPMGLNVCSAYVMERPSHTIDAIAEREENANADNEAAVGIGIDIHSYHENSADEPYYINGKK